MPWRPRAAGPDGLRPGGDGRADACAGCPDPICGDARSPAEPEELPAVTPGQETDRGFLLDNVLHSEEGDIHYNLYVPDSYDGSRPYAVFFTLPGYEGLYFQGVGANLQEAFAFEAQNYRRDMIIVAPQLSDWGDTSARQTIALVEYMLEAYSIDPEQVYANGYSGGGETMSRVLGLRPDLFYRVSPLQLPVDGDYEPVAESRTPVYLVVGEGRRILRRRAYPGGL